MRGKIAIQYLIILLLIIVCSIGSYAGYLIYFASDQPLTKISYQKFGRQHSTLLVFLPGISDSAEDFYAHGFMGEIDRHELPLDGVSVDARVYHYIAKSFVQRLHHDVILPARAEGYRSIWLVGVSLGGYGALLYAREHPQQLAGVIAIAPYLGKTKDAEVFARSGVVDQVVIPQKRRFDRANELWSWLNSHLKQAGIKPLLFLAFGTEDKFAKTNTLLAGLLPREHVLTLRGQHNWVTWGQLWQGLLTQHSLTSLWQMDPQS